MALELELGVSSLFALRLFSCLPPLCSPGWPTGLPEAKEKSYKR